MFFPTIMQLAARVGLERCPWDVACRMAPCTSRRSIRLGDKLKGCSVHQVSGPRAELAAGRGSANQGSRKVSRWGRGGGSYVALDYLKGKKPSALAPRPARALVSLV